ncbi:iron ABC transporter substrate-binding protein [Chryseomicrobium excrementi]|uniref:Iron ABC transporter substrate-binding protein n=1 Tax=Chryseomicrobium excrementi TaxID=2041346 RepID=A0A2M9EXD1_9BACL|nr:helical backbone metal receptor [Chryseomicrobium excrementi]PJK15873.1 iron ABC transporter substrate-binding protein [Chryseomicrobium excrementi]
MRTFTDQLNRELQIPDFPKRIVSICPAITETLFALDATEHIVGRTKFCIFPKGEVERLPHVGGTKDVNIDQVRALKPDLILAEKEENTKETVEALSTIAPVVVMEVQTIDDSYRLIQDLGEVTGHLEQAETIAKDAKLAFERLPKLQNSRVLYFIWRKPYMVVGNTTYIQSVLEHLGLENAAKHLEGRYPDLTPELLKELAPDAILLSSEPFPFSEKHQKELATILPDTPSLLVDGEMFWYGSKMLEASPYYALLVDQLREVARTE